MVEVGEHDVGERQLEQVDLFAQDERQQQVEGAAEDIEVEVERGEGHRLHRTACTRCDAPDGERAAKDLLIARAGGRRAGLRARGRADAHPLAHVGERRRGDLAGPAGAVGQQPLEPASSARSVDVALRTGAR